MEENTREITSIPPHLLCNVISDLTLPLKR